MLSMVIDSISSFMYSKLLVIMLIGTGVYFTIRTKFLQVRLFRSACKAVMEKPDDEDAVSSFQALMVSTASRVGTGNIVGVSSAICIWSSILDVGDRNYWKRICVRGEYTGADL